MEFLNLPPVFPGGRSDRAHTTPPVVHRGLYAKVDRFLRRQALAVHANGYGGLEGNQQAHIPTEIGYAAAAYVQNMNKNRLSAPQQRQLNSPAGQVLVQSLYRNAAQWWQDMAGWQEQEAMNGLGWH